MRRGVPKPWESDVDSMSLLLPLVHLILIAAPWDGAHNCRLIGKETQIQKVWVVPRGRVASWASPMAQRVKNPSAGAGDVGSIPGSGRSPGEANANLLQHSCLENVMDRGAWWATVQRIATDD